MSYSCTYDSLTSDIINITEDESADFATGIPATIALAELQVLRDLDLECFQCEVILGTLTPGVREYEKPLDLLKSNGMWLTIGGNKTFMSRRKYDYCVAYAPDITVQGPPRYIAEKDENNWYFVNTPDQAYVATTYGIVRPDGLSTDQEETWLSTNVGDLLLYAALVQSEKFLVNPQTAQSWATEYADRLAKAKSELRGLSRSDYQAARLVQPQQTTGAQLPPAGSPPPVAPLPGMLPS